jgi:hypothetical protein
MKENKQNEKKSKKQINSVSENKCCMLSRLGLWKTIAIIVVLIFAFFIVGGIIKSYHFRSSFVKPTQEQIDYSTKIATDKLKSLGFNPGDYQIHIANMMRKTDEKIDGPNKDNIIQIAFFNNQSSHTFIIDVTSGEVLIHSQNDIYKQMPKPRNNDHRGFLGPGFIPDINNQCEPGERR